MNVGYTKFDSNEPENCPICGNNIYISKYWGDFACMNENCVLFHGARKIMDAISKELDKLK